MLTPPLTPSSSIHSDDAPSPTRFLIVSNVPRDAVADDLKATFFAHHNPIKGVFVRYQQSHGLVILAFFDPRDAARAAAAITSPLHCRFVHLDELVKLIGDSLFVHETDGAFSIAVDPDPPSTLDLASLKSVLVSFGDLRSLTCHDAVFRVEYHDVRDADAAYAALDAQLIFGARLRLSGRDSVPEAPEEHTPVQNCIPFPVSHDPEPFSPPSPCPSSPAHLTPLMHDPHGRRRSNQLFFDARAPGPAHKHLLRVRGHARRSLSMDVDIDVDAEGWVNGFRYRQDPDPSVDVSSEEPDTLALAPPQGPDDTTQPHPHGPCYYCPSRGPTDAAAFYTACPTPPLGPYYIVPPTQASPAPALHFPPQGSPARAYAAYGTAWETGAGAEYWPGSMTMGGMNMGMGGVYYPPYPVPLPHAQQPAHAFYPSPHPQGAGAKAHHDAYAYDPAAYFPHPVAAPAALAREPSGTGTLAERNQLNLARIEDGQDTRTTVMIKNIPNKMSDRDLVAFIGGVCPRRVDFLYLRMDFQNGCNVGYAFVNFITVQDLLVFARAKLGVKWNMFSSEKVLQMSYANYQGKEALVEKFKNSCIMDEREAWQPKIFHSAGPEQGLPEPFPAPTHLRRKERSTHNRGALFGPGGRKAAGAGPQQQQQQQQAGGEARCAWR